MTTNNNKKDNKRDNKKNKKKNKKRKKTNKRTSPARPAARVSTRMRRPSSTARGEDVARRGGGGAAARRTEAPSRAAASRAATRAASGEAIVAVAREHVGEAYVLGARAPMANEAWDGPWDCAEFASWCVYRATGVLYGVQPDDPILADAYTGYWGEQAERDGATVPTEHAVGIAGACLLRKPGGGPTGHIAISTGDGGTLEAYSSSKGVIAHTASGRRWDYGVLVPGVSYFLAEEAVRYAPPTRVIRLTRPLTRGPRVERIQERLAALGYRPGRIDRIYGPQTAAAVVQFQADRGLVADGEVGDATWSALEGA